MRHERPYSCHHAAVKERTAAKIADLSLYGASGYYFFALLIGGAAGRGRWLARWRSGRRCGDRFSGWTGLLVRADRRVVPPTTDL